MLLIVPGRSGCQPQSLVVIFGWFQPVDSLSLFYGVTQSSYSYRKSYYRAIECKNETRWLQLLSLRLDAYAFVRAVINEMVSMGKNQSSVD